MAGTSRHASVRWARIVVAVVDLSEDPRTVQLWGRAVALSATQLRAYCRLTGIGAKRSLDFARLLRVSVLSGTAGRPLADFLDVRDERTLERLLLRAGVRGSANFTSVSDFLSQQLLVTDSLVLEDLRNQLGTGRLLARRACGGSPVFPPGHSVDPRSGSKHPRLE